MNWTTRLALLVASCAVVGISGLTAPAFVAAQSDTGRTPQYRETVAATQSLPSRWWFAAGAGMATSGDLFTATVAGGPAAWLPPAGGQFNADRFIVTLDEDLAVAVAGGYRLGSRWILRADVSWARLDATAEARAGQTVTLHPYDRLGLLQLSLAAEIRLIRTRCYPYLVAGAVAVVVDAEYASELDQTVLGPRLAVGYLHAFAERWGVRLEVRDTIVSIDTENHRTEPAAGFEPAVTYERVGTQHLFELLALVHLGF